MDKHCAPTEKGKSELQSIRSHAFARYLPAVALTVFPFSTDNGSRVPECDLAI